MKKKEILYTYILPLIVMLLWGTLFPMVKISYTAFNIDTSSVADILMFASVRFVICGILVCILSAVKKEKIHASVGKNIWYIVLVGFFSIFLHYAFTYVGLSVTDSSKSSLIKQLANLLYICFAFLFIKEEKFNKFKIIGAIVGFSGIIAISWTGKSFVVASGDILLMAASVCSVTATIISKISVKNSSVYWVTGISQLSGGILLFITALIMGGSFPVFNLRAILVFLYICAASIAGYILWYVSLSKATVSRLFIVKFAEPLFACIFGALLLGENILKIQYLLAFILICLGISLGNRN